VSGGRKRHADARSAAREAQPRLVDERHVALGVGHPHERGRGVGELAELRLAVRHEILVPRPAHRGSEHARDGPQELALVEREFALAPAVRLEPAEVPLPDVDGHGVGAGGPQVLVQPRGPGALHRLHRQHSSKNALRQPNTRARDHALFVAGELQHGDVVDRNLASGRLDRRLEQLIQLHALQPALSQLRQRGLAARPAP
jgi:hypothetical protein